MADRAGSTVSEVAASHSLYVSQPRASAEVIKRAAQTLADSRSNHGELICQHTLRGGPPQRVSGRYVMKPLAAGSSRQERCGVPAGCSPNSARPNKTGSPSTNPASR
jgi:hypothetical protein